MTHTKTNHRSGMWRSRWAAVGAAVAVTLGAGSMVAVNAAPTAPSSTVSINPLVRILDSRTDAGLSGPFVSGVAQKLQVTGVVPTQPPSGAAIVNREVVPSTATAATFNVTVVRPLSGGFLSIRPGDATGVPATSNINFGPGGPNIANTVNVQLPASGKIDIYVQGTIGDVLIDVAGYTVPATSGPPGPQGDPGDIGPPGPQGLSAWDTIPPGQTVVGNFTFDTHQEESGTSIDFYGVEFPAKAPNPVLPADVLFEGTNGFPTDDPSCTGTVANPTAPPGKVCIYLDDFGGITPGNSGSIGSFLPMHGFTVDFEDPASAGDDMFALGSWAFTAPPTGPSPEAAPAPAVEREGR